MCVFLSVHAQENAAFKFGYLSYETALKSMPLFLAYGKTLSNSQKAYLKTKNPATLTAFGGKSAVSDELVSLIAKASV